MYLSTRDQLFLGGQLSWNFNMASTWNLENKQTSNKAYRKTKYYPKKLKVYLWTSILKLYLQYSYWVFLRVSTSVFGSCFRVPQSY